MRDPRHRGGCDDSAAVHRDPDVNERRKHLQDRLAAREALQKAYDELERKVEERTSDLSMAKKGFKAGDTVTLTVWRGGQEITLSLTFDQQPQTTGTEDDSPNQNQGQQDSYGDLYDYFFGRGNGFFVFNEITQ